MNRLALFAVVWLAGVPAWSQQSSQNPSAATGSNAAAVGVESGIPRPEQFQAADACLRIQAARDWLAAKAGGAGIVDARGLRGFQACSVDPFAGSTVRFTLLLDEVVFRTTTCWRLHSGQAVRGKGGSYGSPTAGTVLQPVTGFRDDCALSFDAATDDGKAGFITQVSATGISVDAENLGPSSDFHAIEWRAASNTGPFDQLAVYNQSCGNALYIGPSSSASAPSWNISDGLTITDFYALTRPEHTVAAACNNDPIALIEQSGEITLNGSRTKLQGRSRTGKPLDGSVGLLIRTNGNLRSMAGVNGGINLYSALAAGVETGFRTDVVGATRNAPTSVFFYSPSCENVRYCVWLGGQENARTRSSAIIFPRCYSFYGNPAYCAVFDYVTTSTFFTGDSSLFNPEGGEAGLVWATPHAQYSLLFAPPVKIKNESRGKSAVVVAGAAYGDRAAFTVGSGTESAPALVVNSAGDGSPRVSLRRDGADGFSISISGAREAAAVHLCAGSSCVEMPKDGAVAFPAGVSVGGKSGPSWTSGADPPQAKCASGSLYSRTSGSPALYVCEKGAWVAK